MFFVEILMVMAASSFDHPDICVQYWQLCDGTEGPINATYGSHQGAKEH